MTQKEAVAEAIRQAVQIRLGPNSLEIANRGGPVYLTGGEADTAAEAAIEALREGARTRLDHLHRWWFSDPQAVIGAILGPKP